MVWDLRAGSARDSGPKSWGMVFVNIGGGVNLGKL